MDDLVDFLIVKMVGGMLTLIFRIAWFLTRIVWWLTIYLILSAGAGVAWLARGRRGREVDTGRFGRFLEDGSGWEEAPSGTVYPASATECEHCEVHAELDGQHWRRTAIARLLRRGAIWRHKFSVVTTADQQVAAWCEFPQEARKNITLDHLDPAMVGIPELQGVDKNAMAINRESVGEAIKELEWLLANRGWKPDGHSTDPANQHWYASRYSRPVIAWNAPVAPPVSVEQSAPSSTVNGSE
jgi:hypothetical protein